MTPLTEKIAELERLLAAATAGPWDSVETRGLHGYEAFILTPSGALGYVPKESERQSGCLFREADGQLIVAMHEALPYFLSLAKRVAGAPVGACPVYAPDSGVGAVSIWFDDAIAADLISGKRVALVEIVGGEES